MSAYSELLLDPRWQRKRLKVLERDCWTCQCCGATEDNLQVHHLKYMKMPWDVPYMYLVTLCKDCHGKVSDRRLMSEIRTEMSHNLTSDLYVLKNHVRYFQTEKLLSLTKQLQDNG